MIIKEPWLAFLLACLLISHATLADDSKVNQPDEALAFELFEYLVESDTTHSTGDTLVVARTIEALLLKEGFARDDIEVIVHGGKGNLVARLRAENPTGEPLLLLGHLDVVEADPADWSVDPMQLHEIDGYFYGRGVLDVKNEIAIHLANFITLHRQGAALSRDIIIALTADEESGPHNGALYLVNERPELVDAGLVINEGGGGLIRDGAYIANTVQAAEKTYQTYSLTLTNAGGHSSMPRADNAIYELARILSRIEAHAFPVRLNDTTRAYFKGLAAQVSGERAQMFLGLLESPPDQKAVAYFEGEPAINSRLRTTCVPTMLKAGHAENALPQRATATVNCRVFPGVAVADVEATLRRVAAADELEISAKWNALFSDASPLDETVMIPIREITEEMWPGAIVLPVMSTGATDSTFFRSAGIPVYGVSGIFTLEGDNRRHGRDERLLIRSFYEGLEFLYRLTRRIAVVPEDDSAASTRL